MLKNPLTIRKRVGDVVPGVVVYLSASMIVPEKPLWGGNNKVCSQPLVFFCRHTVRVGSGAE